MNGLTSNADHAHHSLQRQWDVDPAYLAAGFTGIITSYQPWGNSTYHGWANQLTRRFSNGLQFMAAYTFSHNIDDSTAEVFSTYTTPRRPQNIRDLRADRANSALDHRHRLTYQVLYDTPWFKTSKNWAMKNLVGNWEIAPIYTYQTGTWFTVQSGLDSNLNGDSGGDRAVGQRRRESADRLRHDGSEEQRRRYRGLPDQQSGCRLRDGSQGHPLHRGPQHRAHEPDQRHRCHDRQESSRSTKSISFNSPDASSTSSTTRSTSAATSATWPRSDSPAPQVHNFTIPSTSVFHQASQVFSSNPRSITISAKFIF